jgi:pimeloyl-ACP methyl ester carboxylesterase
MDGSAERMGKGSESTDVRSQFRKLLPHVRTYQELMWLVEGEAALNGKPEISSDAGAPIAASQLLSELEMLEYKEGEAKGLLFTADATRRIQPLQRKIVEIESTRAALNGIYKEETAARAVPDIDEFFTVRMINRHRFDEEHAASPEGARDATPIMIAPGYSVGAEALRRNAIGIAELGRSVATFVVPPTNREFDPRISFPPDTPSLTKIHATALLKAIDTCNEKTFGEGTKFDALGYSQGAINTVVAALAQPEKFRNILLVNPAGLTELDEPYLTRFFKLSKKSFNHRDQVLTEAKRRPLTLRQRFSKEHYLWILDNIFDSGWETFDRSRVMHDEFSPEMQAMGKKGGFKGAVKVADAISRTNLIPMIQKVQQLGVRVAILPAEEDPLFDVAQIEEAGKKAGVEVYGAAGAHANVGFRPGAMASLYIDCFQDMNEAAASKKEVVLPAV